VDASRDLCKQARFPAGWLCSLGEVEAVEWCGSFQELISNNYAAMDAAQGKGFQVGCQP